MAATVQVIDVEKSAARTEKAHVTTTVEEYSSSPTTDDEVARTRELQDTFPLLKWLNQGERWLDARLGIETQGIDRIPDDQKKPPSIWNCFLMWWSLDCHVGILPIGVVGPEFGLSLQQSVSAIVVGAALGALCPAYCATLGPKTGLRAVAVARYSFGYYGAKLCAILNVVVAGGFAVLNVVLAGQILSAASEYKMTTVAGSIIVSVISYILSFFGFSVVHAFERYAWIVSFVLISVLLGQVSPHIDASAPGQLSGTTLAGVWLTFMSINFAGTAAWCTYVCDYYCNYRADTKSWKVFWLTFLGLTTALTFTVTIGACVGNAAMNAAYPKYAEAYENHQLGGLIHEIYHPEGWSKFCLVILAMSVIGNNVMVHYSSGLSLQLLGRFCHAIPRFIWSFLDVLVITIIAVAGKSSLSAIVSNFVSLLGYWAIAFVLIVLVENEWFRKGRPEKGYNLGVWNDAKRLPVGAAAIISLLAAYLGGGLMGMTQMWYVGPIAKKFGPYGGDVGIYLSAAITLVCYPALRYLERKWTGR